MVVAGALKSLGAAVQIALTLAALGFGTKEIMELLTGRAYKLKKAEVEAALKQAKIQLGGQRMVYDKLVEMIREERSAIEKKTEADRANRREDMILQALLQNEAVKQQGITAAYLSMLQGMGGVGERIGQREIPEPPRFAQLLSV